MYSDEYIYMDIDKKKRKKRQKTLDGVVQDIEITCQQFSERKISEETLIMTVKILAEDMMLVSQKTTYELLKDMGLLG